MGEALIKEFEEKLKNIIEKFRPEIASVRTNRPNIQLIESIKVLYFDQNLDLKQVASVSVSGSREVQISVWDKGAVPGIVKALEDSGLGLTPNVEGNTIHLNMPPLTKDRREELIKLAKKMTEEVRIRVRGLRDEVNKDVRKLESEGTLSEDQEFVLKEKIQKQVDAVNKDLENLLDKKIKEIND